MAKRLGATFLRCALGPIHYAGECILGRRIPEGLQELSKESLLGGVDRGIVEVAAKAGVRRREIAAVVPMNDVWHAAETLGEAQVRAAATWKSMTGGSGLITGAADLTVDGRGVPATECLRRLAKKLEQDEALAQPLLDLADEVDRWQELVSGVRTRLEQEDALERAFARRRMRRVGALAAVITIVVGGAGAGSWVLSARARVADVLDHSDPCEAQVVESSDLRFATDTQKAQLEENARVCVEQARIAEEERKAREERERKQREEKERREARIETCAALAKNVAAGTWSESDAPVAGEASALLKRVAEQALEEGDLGSDEPALPCADTDAGAELHKAFSKAVVAQPRLWTKTRVSSKRLASVLADRRGELRNLDVRMFESHAEKDAATALTGGKAEEIARAAGVCRLLGALELPTPRSCSAVIEMADEAGQ